MVADELTDGIKALGDAVGALFRGQFDEMLVNLLSGATVIGVFLIILFLMKLVLELTLFKNPEHKKYATWIGVGVALIGIMNDQLFLFIYQIFGGSLPLILLLILTIGIIIIFVNRIKKSHYETSADTRRAHTDAISARKDLRKEDHELSLQEKMERRELGAINKAETIVDDELRGIRSFEQLVTKLRQLLGQLAQTTDQTQAQQLRSSLMRGAQALPTLLKREYIDEQELNKHIHTLQNEFLQDIKLDGDEDAIFNHLHSHLAKQLTEEHNIGENSARVKILGEEQQLRNFLHQAQQLDQARQPLLQQLKDVDEKELSQTKQLNARVNELIQSLNAADINQSLNNIATIQQLLQAETTESTQLRNLLNQARQLTSKHEQLNEHLDSLVKQMMRVERQDAKHTGHEEHDQKQYFEALKKYVEELKNAGMTGDPKAQKAQNNIDNHYKKIREHFAKDKDFMNKVDNYLGEHNVSTNA